MRLKYCTSSADANIDETPLLKKTKTRNKDMLQKYTVWITKLQHQKKQKNKKQKTRDQIYFTLPFVLSWISFSCSGFLRLQKIHQSSSFLVMPWKYNSNKGWTKTNGARVLVIKQFLMRQVTHISRVASLVTSPCPVLSPQYFAAVNR